MAERKGECCIASWGDGHVANGFNNTSKMDMIMLKFRPIAPKPVAGSLTTASGTSDGGGSGEVRHAKAGGGGGRGRKKTTTSSNNTSTRSMRKCTNIKKRKSTSPENNNNNNNNNNNQKYYYYHDYHDEVDQTVGNEYQKSDPTLLPLFPEAPDLSPNSSSNSSQVVGQNMVPFWVKFDENTGITPCFEAFAIEVGGKSKTRG